MRRFWYLKYLVTLLASTAITFHLLHSKISANFYTASELNQEVSPGNRIDNANFMTHELKMTRGDQDTTTRQKHSGQPSWVVLPGNVTVHEGQENVPLDFTFSINSEKICDTFDHSRKTLVIFVASSADHFSQRRVIRETWGLKLLQDAYNYRIVFILGSVSDGETQESVVYEGYRYGDLIQINVTESFRNLGRKSVAGLQWSRKHCGGADFVAKTDDDILLHVPNLLLAIHAATSPDSLLLCHENRMRRILRGGDLSEGVPAAYSKYEVSPKELPGTYYPPYCSGMAYAFSSSVRDRLLEACRTTPVFFIEDVYLTGFCRHKAGVIVTPHAGVTLRPAIEAHQAACVFRDGRITSQEVGVRQLKELWAEMNTQGFFCPQLVGPVLS